MQTRVASHYTTYIEMQPHDYVVYIKPVALLSGRRNYSYQERTGKLTACPFGIGFIRNLEIEKLKLKKC